MAVKRGGLLCRHYLCILTVRWLSSLTGICHFRFPYKQRRTKEVQTEFKPLHRACSVSQLCDSGKATCWLSTGRSGTLEDRAAEPLRAKSPPVKPTSAQLTPFYQRWDREPVCHAQILGKSHRNLRERELEDQLLFYLCKGSLQRVVKRLGILSWELLDWINHQREHFQVLPLPRLLL